MKILCLVDKYHPDSSANTVCCDNIADYFKSKGHQVDIATIKWNVDDNDYDVYNGSNIIKLDTYWIGILRKKGKKYNATKWSDFPWLFRKCNSLIRKIKCIFRRNFTNFMSLDCIDYNYSLKAIQKINSHYDILITFTMPAALQVIGNELMKRKLADRWYPIFLDAYVHNKALSNQKINYRKKLISRILKRANHIFMVDGIKGENLKQGYNPEYHNKTTEIFIPMIKEMNLPNIEKTTKTTTLIYAGMFYRDLRNPEKMLEILSKLSENEEINIFGQCCEDIIEEKMPLFKNCKLNFNGLIPHKECLEEISKADILINLGNSITNQMPSKILEYISFGKPIVNFYFTEEDMCLPILKKYPLSININVNNYTEEDIENLKLFIKKNKGVKLNFEDATKNLVEYRVNSIADKIYKVVMK